MHARPWRTLQGWSLCFLASLTLYALTAKRGAQWQDYGYHILRVVTHEALNPLGLALSHPLHHWIGRFAVSLNLTEPCLAVTLISSLAGAIAVANVFGCVWSLTHSRPSAFFSAASLATALTFWQMSTVTETYTLAAALLGGECWCVILYAMTRRSPYIMVALLLNGLGVSNHMFAALTTPVLGAVVLHGVATGAVRGRSAVLSGTLWLIGSSLYLGMGVEEWIRTGDAWGTLQSAVFGRGYAHEVLNTSLSLNASAISAAFVVVNFPNLLLPAAGFGLLARDRMNLPTVARRSLLASLILHAAFALRYPVPDQHTFFVPMYVLLAVFGGTGFSMFVGRCSGPRRKTLYAATVVLLALTPVFYTFLPDTARRLGLLSGRERHRPYRDDYVYLFTPWSVAEESAERMSREAVTLAEPVGVILVEDRMAEFAVRYRLIQAGREDLPVLGAAEPAALAGRWANGRSVVLVPGNVEHPPQAPEGFQWKRTGDLYVLDRIVARPPSG